LGELINIGVAYEWSGFLGSLSDGNSTFNGGSMIAVRFELTGLASGVTDATARLYLARIVNGVVALEFAATPNDNANTGNLFRYDPTSGEYVFNLKTKGLSPGTYRLRVDLNDGVEREYFSSHLDDDLFLLFDFLT
jgi:hypothetical protein